MNKIVRLTTFALITVFSTCGQSKKNVDAAIKNKSSGFAVIELFTSQGCSSCPPADKILGQLAEANDPNIFPLAFHVDYWNRLGWKDPFSSVDFSDRQRAYAGRFQANNVYTPQVVINGSTEAVGSNYKKVTTLIDEALAEKSCATLDIVSANVDGKNCSVSFTAKSFPKNAVANIALVKKSETTSIKRGENNGLTQKSHNIVIAFETIETVDGENSAKIALPANFKSSEFIIVVYGQQNNLGKIITAARAEIAEK